MTIVFPASFSRSKIFSAYLARLEIFLASSLNDQNIFCLLRRPENLLAVPLHAYKYFPPPWTIRNISCSSGKPKIFPAPTESLERFLVQIFSIFSYCRYTSVYDGFFLQDYWTVLWMRICVDANPDPAYHFHADPDPIFHFDADLDPSFQIRPLKMCLNRLMIQTFWPVICKLLRIRIRIQLITLCGSGSS